jgi:hypothetical protein
MCYSEVVVQKLFEEQLETKHMLLFVQGPPTPHCAERWAGVQERDVATCGAAAEQTEGDIPGNHA